MGGKTKKEKYLNLTTGRDVRIGDDVVIGRNVRIGDDVIIERGVTIYDNVIIGSRVYIGERVTLGERLRDYYRDPSAYNNPPTYISENSVIRCGTIVYGGTTIGADFECASYVSIREQTRIGNNCSLGTFCDIQGYVEIGNYVRLHSNVHVGQNSFIKNNVWIFPYVVLTNDLHPPCALCPQGPTIKEYAVVSTGAVILPRIQVGQGSLVGAMALVTKDVPDGKVVVGMPARVVADVTEIGCGSQEILSQNPSFKPYPWKDYLDPSSKLLRPGLWKK